MAYVIEAIKTLYIWIGKYLETVLPAELFTALNDLPDPDFDSFVAE